MQVRVGFGEEVLIPGELDSSRLVALESETAHMHGGDDVHIRELAVVDVSVGDVRAVAIRAADPFLPAAVRVNGLEVVHIRVLVAGVAGSVELAGSGEVVLADRDVLATVGDLERAVISVVERVVLDLVCLCLKVIA